MLVIFSEVPCHTGHMMRLLTEKLVKYSFFGLLLNITGYSFFIIFLELFAPHFALGITFIVMLSLRFTLLKRYVFPAERQYFIRYLFGLLSVFIINNIFLFMGLSVLGCSAQWVQLASVVLLWPISFLILKYAMSPKAET